jgi:hypothetical protein
MEILNYQNKIESGALKIIPFEMTYASFPNKINLPEIHESKYDEDIDMSLDISERVFYIDPLYINENDLFNFLNDLYTYTFEDLHFNQKNVENEYKKLYKIMLEYNANTQYLSPTQLEIDEYKQTHKKLRKAYIIIRDYENVIETMKEETFKEFFNKWIIELLKKIKYKTTKNQVNHYIIRSCFDIIFKYAFDIEITPMTEIKNEVLCSNEFRKLQFDILTDIDWSIKPSKKLIDNYSLMLTKKYIKIL